MSEAEKQIARRVVYEDDAIQRIKSHYTIGVADRDRRFNDGLDIAICEIRRAEALDTQKIVNDVLNEISKFADVKQSDTMPATEESAIAFLRTSGWLEKHDREIREDERNAIAGWERDYRNGQVQGMW